MQFHPTPFDVVALYKKHLPTQAGLVLEPSAGDGALLSCFNGSSFKFSDFFLIDKSIERASVLKQKFPEAKVFCEDFLLWEGDGVKFSCIVANPPFLSKSGCSVNYKGMSLSIEAAFVLKMLDFLESDGVLISILPGSVITSDKGRYIREVVCQHHVECCYQLPGRMFQSVEGVFFVLVLRKSRHNTGGILLRKVFSDGQVNEIILDFNLLEERGFRLDFDYNSTFLNGVGYSDRISDVFGCLESYRCISAVRGKIRNDYKRSNLVHSTYFSDGYWANDLDFLEDYVIVCQRVSRKCHESFGLLERRLVKNCTDCVVVIDVPRDKLFNTLLFLRVFYSQPESSMFFVRGTGAKYISVKALSEIDFFDLSSLVGDYFAFYFECYFSGNIDRCKVIEREIFEMLMVV